MDKELKESFDVLKVLGRQFSALSKVNAALAVIEAHEADISSIESRRNAALTAEADALGKAENATLKLRSVENATTIASENLASVRNEIALGEKEKQRLRLDYNIALAATKEECDKIREREVGAKLEELGRIDREVAFAKADYVEIKRKHAEFLTAVGGKR